MSLNQACWFSVWGGRGP